VFELFSPERDPAAVENHRQRITAGETRVIAVAVAFEDPAAGPRLISGHCYVAG
jgi:hypothetical protein